MNPHICRRLLWVAFHAATALTLVLAFLPGRIAGRIYHSGNTEHFYAFALLAGLAALAARPGNNTRIVAALTALGLFIELVQLRIPGRAFELLDLAADFAGIGFVLLLFRFLPLRLTQFAHTQATAPPPRP